MKISLKTTVVCAVASLTLTSNAATYTDSVGETIFGGILDITSVEVNSTTTDLIFKVNLAGDPIATDWGKYMIGLDTVPGGDPVGNGWGRPIGMASGMDYWVGSWVDSGNGAEVRNWTGAAWNLQSATYGPNLDNLLISKDATSMTIQFKYAGLGLVPGSTFKFDLYSSGGNGSDSAVDALANPLQSVADWGNPYNSGNLTVSYTIPVPEPTSLALLGIGASLIIGRFIRRR